MAIKIVMQLGLELNLIGSYLFRITATSLYVNDIQTASKNTISEGDVTDEQNVSD